MAIRKFRRRCDKCQGSLTGRRGHGFVTFDGKAVWCTVCTFPKRKDEPSSWGFE